MVIDVRVKQALLRSVLPDGTAILLVVLHDDRCAILRNADVIHEAAGDADGIDGAVQRFMAMTQPGDVLGGGGEGSARNNDDHTTSQMRGDVTRAADALVDPATAATAAAAGGDVAPRAASP